MTNSTPKSGIYRDVPDAVYRGWEAISQSQLKRLEKTPAHYRYGQYSGSAAFKIGKLQDCLLFTPSEFDQHFVLGPHVKSKNSKIWQDAKKQAQTEHKELIDRKELAECEPRIEAIRRHADASDLLFNAAKLYQPSMLWQDEHTGLRCKGRMDLLIHDEHIIVDYKTCESAATDAIRRSVENYGYHIQAAFYSDGYEVITNHHPAFLFLFQEKSAPYEIQLVELNGMLFEAGREQCQRWLDIVYACTQAGHWPGYGTGITII